MPTADLIALTIAKLKLDVKSSYDKLVTILKIGRRWRAAWIPMALALGLSALGGCAWLDTKQRQLIYRPTPGVPAHFTGLRVGDEQFFLPVPATPQTLSTGEAPAAPTGAAPAASTGAPTHPPAVRHPITKLETSSIRCTAAQS